MKILNSLDLWSSCEKKNSASMQHVTKISKEVFVNIISELYYAVWAFHIGESKPSFSFLDNAELLF